jgi:hypothetical protein
LAATLDRLFENERRQDIESILDVIVLFYLSSEVISSCAVQRKEEKE